MEVSQRGIDGIKHWEQLRLSAYMPTPNDKWTIGWGHTGTAYEGMVVSEDEAEDLILDDLEWVERDLNRKIVCKYPLMQCEYDALVSFTFNVGSSWMDNSGVLRELQAGNYDRIPRQIRRWNKQTNKSTGKKEVVKGLVARRSHEVDLWRGPVDPTSDTSALASEPEGQPLGKLLTGSKTAMAGQGVGAMGIMGAYNGAKEVADENAGFIEWISMNMSDPTFMLALGGVAMGIYLIWNRYNDSDTGRAY